MTHPILGDRLFERVWLLVKGQQLMLLVPWDLHSTSQSVTMVCSPPMHRCPPSCTAPLRPWSHTLRCVPIMPQSFQLWNPGPRYSHVRDPACIDALVVCCCCCCRGAERRELLAQQRQHLIPAQALFSNGKRELGDLYVWGSLVAGSLEEEDSAVRAGRGRWGNSSDTVGVALPQAVWCAVAAAAAAFVAALLHWGLCSCPGSGFREGHLSREVYRGHAGGSRRVARYPCGSLKMSLPV